VKLFLTAFLLFGGLAMSLGVGATTIYQYSGTPSGVGTGFNNSNPAAIKITPSTNATVSTILVSLGSFGTPSNPIVVTICNDNGSGTAPSGTCPATFTTGTSSIPMWTDVTYTGSYSATANAPFWIKFSSLSTGFSAFWSVQNTGSNTGGSYTYNPGTVSWDPASDFVVTVSGTVPASAPTATSGAASSITTTGATLNGTVNDNGASTTVTFNYGLTNAYGSSVTATQSPVAAGAGSTAVSAGLTGLTCNTTYHFGVTATNSVNTTNGSDATFTTSACAVAVPTLSEWTQSLLALMAITLLGWHFHREGSY
jgi:hypothetical protein